MFGGIFDESKKSRPKFTQEEKELHYKAQNGKCNGCGKKFDIRNLTVDHIKAWSKGGTERGHNLQLLCGACNSTKGDRTQGEFKKRLAAQGVTKSSTSTKGNKAAPKKKAASKAASKKRPARQRDPIADFFSF